MARPATTLLGDRNSLHYFCVSFTIVDSLFRWNAFNSLKRNCVFVSRKWTSKLRGCPSSFPCEHSRLSCAVVVVAVVVIIVFLVVVVVAVVVHTCIPCLPSFRGVDHKSCNYVDFFIRINFQRSRQVGIFWFLSFSTLPRRIHPPPRCHCRSLLLILPLLFAFRSIHFNYFLLLN